MPRSIWSGAISFGLINIPVELMPAEKRTDLRFHLVDARDKARVRYERVNAETGEEVPWKEVVKAFEFEKGNYVVLEDKDFKAASPEHAATIDIEGFVALDEIGPEYFERPYYLVPGKRGEKGYALLRDTLAKQKAAGLARIVIRTREHLTLLMVRDAALMLFVLRYPQEIVAADTYAFPAKSARGVKISPRETEMAAQLVESMTREFSPKDYKDDFRDKLHKLIATRIKGKGRKRAAPPAKAGETPKGKVVDFMALLKKSIDENKRTPARSSSQASSAKKTSPGKAARRKG